jgi:glycosyltransferase involved in cell wall biosynthesis
MRILCVADEFPWPPTSGYRIRIATTLAGLAETGDVDLFCSVAERPDLAEGDQPAREWAARLHVHRRDRYRPTVRGLVRWLTSGLPRGVAWIDWQDAAAALERWAPGGYDLVWFSHAHAWAGIPRPHGEPTVVDFDNLEDEKLRSLLPLRPSTARSRLGELLDRRDIGRWHRLQLRAAAASRAVVVCSEADRARSGAANAVVVPNGFPGAPVERRDGGPPVFTMVGLMTYPPNEDGARWFATDALPLIREGARDAVFRVVGRDDGGLAELDSIDGVERTGEVDDVHPLLADTTAVVVPLRAGSGTRVKILEAFAAGIPVVSTALGCEGLDARDGVELLVADTPRELASACLRLAHDPAGAGSIAAAGHALWEARYRPETIQAQVAAVARQAAQPGPSAGSSSQRTASRVPRRS